MDLHLSEQLPMLFMTLMFSQEKDKLLQNLALELP